MTSANHEGQIFLSHPHMYNGFFFLVHHSVQHFVLEPPGKGFQKILNSLRCDMVTSFEHFKDVTHRRATSVLPAYVCTFLSFPRAVMGL